MLWTNGSEHQFGRMRAIREGEWWMAPALIWHLLDDTISTVIFSAFLLITPFRLAREGITGETGVLIGCWCAYLAVAGLYAPVHLEPRYLTPVLAIADIVGVVNVV
jgi:hypothetical protein